MRTKLGAVVVAALIVPSLSACQGKAPAAVSRETSAVVSTSPAASSAVVAGSPAPASSRGPSVVPPVAVAPASAPGPSGVPSARSLVPDGIYRSHIEAALVTRGGADPGNGDAGTWTLTVKAGTYQMACRPVSDPDSDCGNDGVDGLATVEVGSVRGSGSTVWFVDQQDAGGYHVHWTLHGRSLVFSDFVGFGHFADEDPVNSETLQPWTRIS